VVDRLVVRSEDRQRLHDSIETALRAAEGLVELVRHDTSTSVLFSERFACPKCDYSLAELEPRQFSFNSPFGACPACGGLGTKREVSPDLILGDARISILEGVILPWGEPTGYLAAAVIPTLARAFKFDPAAPWGSLPAKVRQVLLHGYAERKLVFQYFSGKASGKYESEWEGILKNVERRYKETTSDAVREQLEAYMTELPCDVCGGKRLKPESLSVLVNGKSIGDIVDLPVGQSRKFFETLPLRNGSRKGIDPEIAGPILKEVVERLRFLDDVGLDYLTMGRAAA